MLIFNGVWKSNRPYEARLRHFDCVASRQPHVFGRWVLAFHDRHHRSSETSRLLTRKCCKPEIRRARNGSSSPSDNGGQTEEPCHKRDLTNDVAFLQPPHLSLADHVHRLDALNRSRGRIEGANSLTGSHPSFDRSVIPYGPKIGSA